MILKVFSNLYDSPMESLCRSRFTLKDCSLWRGPKLELEKKREVLHPSDHFCGPPLDPLQQAFPVLRTLELDAVLQELREKLYLMHEKDNTNVCDISSSYYANL
ncbi:hypothetical protein QYF61_011379 [Mycteria americana]|uniref:Uncharacterized protein n=1 Tax=Mycteria americana TaxID=33587 RepID=A0AAN7N4M2_MYCAM|nr:hypothetical protein QYF61_011379 [Mycteria americana]